MFTRPFNRCISSLNASSCALAPAATPGDCGRLRADGAAPGAPGQRFASVLRGFGFGCGFFGGKKQRNDGMFPFFFRSLAGAWCSAVGFHQGQAFVQAGGLQGAQASWEPSILQVLQGQNLQQIGDPVKDPEENGFFVLKKRPKA